MRCDTSRRALAAPLLASAVAFACGAPPADRMAAASTGPAAPANGSPGTVPHGDHNPRHGGLVLMKGDLHYEVVLDRTGRLHRVYFTDAIRDELPASIASSVTLRIKRENESEETIALQIDESGESWSGEGRAVGSPGTTAASVAFTIGGEPYSIDVPFATPATPAEGVGVTRK